MRERARSMESCAPLPPPSVGPLRATREPDSTGVARAKSPAGARLCSQAGAHLILDDGGIAEPAVACHGMDQLTVHGDIERPALPRNELDAREPGAELEHQSLCELERLRLVPALGAIRDLDPVRDRGHAATRVAISRSSRTTSALANLAFSSRIFVSSAWSCSRTSSAS